ncbi:hypothetical protein HNY73_021685 [Argiope bruennichi]|uniref:Uncharacterized protein n=2 Tax=Argiope bruennichi TaxID=94029 RepID=A0A8T0DZ95_ARGBR|nr:hypothetical protein HNY73_021685 [Argiope bruennichi]
MMFCSVIVSCLLVIGLHGNAATELSVNGAKYTVASISRTNTTTNAIDNSTGFYVAIEDLAQQPIVTEPVTVTEAATTAIVIVTRSMNEPAENNTRFTCGKYNPCHWQLYTEERTFEMEYPSVCDCPNNTI